MTTTEQGVLVHLPCGSEVIGGYCYACDLAPLPEATATTSAYRAHLLARAIANPASGCEECGRVPAVAGLCARARCHRLALRRERRAEHAAEDATHAEP